jgi:hypothetical protein
LERRLLKPRGHGIATSENGKCARKKNKNYRMKKIAWSIKGSPPVQVFPAYKVRLSRMGWVHLYYLA